MSKFVPEALRKAAEIYEERNALYGDNYKRHGQVMVALFPGGVYHSDQSGREQPAEHVNRYALLNNIVAKLTRYCANFEKGGHQDSLDDLAVYAMMLQELDHETFRLFHDADEFIDKRHLGSLTQFGGIDPE